MYSIKWPFGVVAIITLAFFPTSVASSTMQGAKNVHTDHAVVVSNPVRSSATATFEGRQERDSLLLTGLTCLIVGTTLRSRTRRHTAEHQPVASDALVSQTHLPLAS